MSNPVQRAFRRVRGLPMEVRIGLIVVIVIVIAAILAPILAPYGPDKTDILAALEPPSVEHWFGTDAAGRDVFSRVLYGLRLDLVLVTIVTLVCFVIGTMLGSLAGYFGGWLDTAVSRVADTVIALPFLVVVMAIVAVMGAGVVGVCIGIVVVAWAVYARLARSEMLSVREQEYLLAAKSLGYSNNRILWRHALPNVVQPGAIWLTIDAVGNLMALAAMSYLGFGVQPPQANLGSIIASGQQYLLSAWWISTLPAIVLLLLGVGVGLIGEGLQGRQYAASGGRDGGNQ